MSKLKKTTTGAAVVIVAAAGTVAGLEASNTTHWFHSKPVSSASVSNNSGSTSANSHGANNQLPTSQQKNAAGKGNTNKPTTEKRPPSNSGHIGLTVTYAGVNTSMLDVDTQISGTTSGACTLTVSQPGQRPVSRTENVTVPPHLNYYDCPPFNVPLSEFPDRGDWNVKVTLTSGDSTASSSWSHNPVNLGN